MRVLLDENLPHDLTGALIGHSVSTVQALGWAGPKNGALLKRASGLIDALVTIDGSRRNRETAAVSGCVSQPRDRGSNPRSGTKKVRDPCCCQSRQRSEGSAHSPLVR